MTLMTASEEIPPGRLEVITGCMFSGKTEELLRRLDRARLAQKEVALFRPEIDSRYSPDHVVTHNGRTFPCYNVPTTITWASLEQAISPVTKKLPGVLGFDEAQFFSLMFVWMCENLVRRGRHVIVAGLDLTFRGEPFGPMAKLMAYADEVTKLTAVCTVCGEPATRTQRMKGGEPVLGGPEIAVGGKESYEPRCPRHFMRYSPPTLHSFLGL